MRFERIELSGHARKRMRQRNIPRRQILRALNYPDRRYAGAEEGELVAERVTEAGNVVVVVNVESPEEHPEADAFIITVVRR